MSIIIATILANGTSVAVVSFLLKLWIDKRLSYSLDLELEKFKSELAKEVARDSIQQKWVNDKRMELLYQLYELMVEMDFELKALHLNIKVQSEEFTKFRAEKFCTKYTELNSALHRNEIFLVSDFIDEIRMIYRPYFKIGMECLKGDEEAAHMLRAHLPDSVGEITALADEPRRKLIQSFRRAAGISA